MRSLWFLLWVCLALSSNAFLIRRLGQLVAQASNKLCDSHSAKASSYQTSQELAGENNRKSDSNGQASGERIGRAGLISGGTSTLQNSYSRKATRQSESKEKSSEKTSFVGSQIATDVKVGANSLGLGHRSLAESFSSNKASEKSEQKKSKEEYEENASLSMQIQNSITTSKPDLAASQTLNSFSPIQTEQQETPQNTNSENSNQASQSDTRQRQDSNTPGNTKISVNDDRQKKETTAKGANFNKKKSRKAKVKSTQSIRILTPGRNTAGIDAAKAGTYSRKTTSLGQSSSKHKADARSASVASQIGSRTDSASVASSHERGVDANQNARITSDSTGMNEILLTQTSVAQSKKKKAVSKSSSDTASSTEARTAEGKALGRFSASIATASKQSSSSRSASSQQSEVVEESFNVKQLAGQQIK